MLALHKDARGVTLAELVMVLAIVGVLAALAVPSFLKVLPGIRLKGDARDVASIMRLARMRAVADRTQYGIYFDDEQTPPQYILFQDLDEDEVLDVSADSVVFSQELYRKTLYRRVNFSDNTAVLKTDGTSNGGWVSLGLVQSSDSLVVDVLPSTGRVKVIK